MRTLKPQEAPDHGLMTVNGVSRSPLTASSTSNTHATGSAVEMFPSESVTAFNQDLVTFRGLLRTDGDLIDTTGAIKHYLGASS